MNALKPRPPFQVLIMSEESRLGREQMTFYLRSTDGKLHGRAQGANGHESQYLLTGLPACGTCAGGLTVHSRAWGTGRQQTYVCGHYHRKGTTVCTNRRVLPMVATTPRCSARSKRRACHRPPWSGSWRGRLRPSPARPRPPRRVNRPSGVSLRPSRERSHATRQPSARRRTSRRCSTRSGRGSASERHSGPSSTGCVVCARRDRSTAAWQNVVCAP
jgi:hypothetical protein